MKHFKRDMGMMLTGAALGAALFGGVSAVAAGITAEPSWSPIYVDGQQVSMTAYNILGNNYVKLRDIGQAVGFNVYWNNGVQVDSTASYTGEAPVKAELISEPSTVSASEPATDVVQDLETIRQEAVELTNAIRREHGQSAIPMDDMLNRAAQVRADEIAATSTYSHTRPDGSSCKTVTNRPSYTAENLHCIDDLYLQQQKERLGYAMVTLLSRSPGHLNNMINPRITAIGIGIARGVDESGFDCWYCVQLFVCDGQTVTWVDEPILQK